MRKIIILFIIQIFSIVNTFAGGGEGINKVEYGFILGEVGNVNIVTLDKSPYYSLESGEDKRKYYNFDLENYNYITNNGIQTKLLNKKVHIYENEFNLDFLSGEYKKGTGYRPKKGDYIITIYNLKNSKNFQNFENKDIYNLYLTNKIIKSDYINTTISRVINCEYFSNDFLSYLGESIGVPNNFYKTEQEKIDIQSSIIKDVIKLSGICKKNSNIKPITKDNTKEINNITKNSKSNYSFYFIYLLLGGLIFYITKYHKRKL